MFMLLFFVVEFVRIGFNLFISFVSDKSWFGASIVSVGIKYPITGILEFT